MKIQKKPILLLVCGLLVGSLTQEIALNERAANETVAATGQGDVRALKAAFEKWRQAYESQGGDATRLRLPLAHSRSFSARSTDARGTITLDLMTGNANVQTKGLALGNYSVWLVDNRNGAGRTVKPEEGDGLQLLGNFESAGESAQLEAKLDRSALENFDLDMVAITPAGSSPLQTIVLNGAPDLMQRLYYSDKPWAMAATNIKSDGARKAASFDFLLPKLAWADDRFEHDLEAVLGEQIAKGREIFLNETFDGNGRTCGTCHRPDNNHTIDPKYIARLPKDDPLFVAEYNPALKDLEKPELMRQFGLVLANVDGFDRPGVMRGVPYTLALSTSIEVEISKEHGGNGEFPQDEAFSHALGWAGDGSAGTGSLREFTLGAIIQHFPKTLNRQAGVDFRLPSDEELIAVEAYMRSLGRSKDFDLARLNFNSPVVQKGKSLFDTKQNPVVDGQVVQGETANCNGCHMNGGARSSTTFANPTRDTGVENMRQQVASLVDPGTPVDGGFGTESRGNCGPKFDHTCYGESRFNTPPLIEAADTAPFFHNNSVNTLEEAIAFYNGDAFNLSPGSKTSSGKDRRVKLESSQVVAVALFLRHLNAVENIFSSNRLDRQAMRLKGKSAREMIRLAIADTEDALEVLREGQLLPNPQVIDRLEAALRLETLANHSPGMIRDSLLQKAIERKRQARDLMVSCDPDALGSLDTNPQRVYSCEEFDRM